MIPDHTPSYPSYPIILDPTIPVLTLQQPDPFSHLRPHVCLGVATPSHHMYVTPSIEDWCLTRFFLLVDMEVATVGVSFYSTNMGYDTSGWGLNRFPSMCHQYVSCLQHVYDWEHTRPSMDTWSCVMMNSIVLQLGFLGDSLGDMLICAPLEHCIQFPFGVRLACVPCGLEVHGNGHRANGAIKVMFHVYEHVHFDTYIHT